MQHVQKQDERVVRYLLGDLTEEEQSVLEAEYFADQEKFEEIRAAENDLVDAYVRDRLPRAQRELFERNYLQSPKHRQRVAVAERLLEAADQAAADDRVEDRNLQTTASWLSRMKQAFQRPPILQQGMASAALALLFLSAGLLLFERARLNEELGKAKAELSEQQRLQRERDNQLAAEREQRDKLKSELQQLQESIAQKPVSSPQPNRLSVLSFLLSPIRVRTGDGSQQQISISRDTGLVRLRMNVEEGDSRSFQATVGTVGGERILEQQSLRPRSNAVSVNIPADKLPMGDYILRLSATNSSGQTEEVNRYFFRIVRK